MTEFQYLNQGNSEAQDRLATSFLLSQTSTGLARTGVLSGLAVAQTTTASSAVTISAGAGNSQDTVGNGAAVMVNDTLKTLDILTANPMGGVPRNDIVVFDSATTSIRTIIGVPNASPADPTVPNTAIPLARVRNAAGATTISNSAIDDLRSFIGLIETPQPFADFYRGVGGTIPTGTWTVLGFPNQVAAENGLACSSGIWTVPIPGRYRCATQVMFPGAAGLTQMGAMINVNGSTFAFGYSNTTTAANWSYYLARTIRFNAGDQVSFSGFHNATAPLATAADIHSTWAQVERVGA